MDTSSSKMNNQLENKMHIIINTEFSNGKEKIEVNSIEEAQQAWISHRNGGNAYGEFPGASQMKKGCGDVMYDDKLIARIAYNGRIVTPTDKHFNVK